MKKQNKVGYKITSITTNRSAKFFKTGKDKMRINLTFESIGDISGVCMKEIIDQVFNKIYTLEFKK